MTLKIYSKGERVLRIEVIVHNAKAYRWGHSLPCFPEIVVRLKEILERFLNAVGCINSCFVSDEMPESLPRPAQIGQTQVGGIDLNKPRMRLVAEAVLALSAVPSGFTSPDLASQVRSTTGKPESEYARRAAYDIKKLRAKGMVTKIGKSRRYETVPGGLRSLTPLLFLREKIIRPLLAASRQPEPTAKPAHPTPLDNHYKNLRNGMRHLFIDLGIAA